MHSHMVNPYGCGWHVDRRAFDRMLAHAATAAGACLFEGSDLRRSEYRNACWWLQAASEGPQGDIQERTLCARMLIDATGRRAKVARALGAKRMLFDRLVGIASHWAGVDPVEQSHLLVEATPDGWWYSAPLPGSAQGEAGAMITMLMTDADLCGRLRLGGADRWQAVLHSTQATHERLGSARRVSAPQVHCAHSQRLRRDVASDTGPWLAVGDAALSVDPVSGSGVVRALRTARAAADTVHGLLADPHAWRDAVAAYESARDDECTSFLVERARYYAAEQRFDSPFWQRRAAVTS
jgi:flavin-dependent dehydrogenase